MKLYRRDTSSGRRNRQVNARFSQKEYEQLEKAAKAHNMGVTTYVAMVSLHAAKNPKDNKSVTKLSSN